MGAVNILDICYRLINDHVIFDQHTCNYCKTRDLYRKGAQKRGRILTTNILTN